MNYHEKFARVIPPASSQHNPDMLQKLSEGSEKAFNWLYMNHCKTVYQYAFLLTGNESMSEDIVQDVFAKIWQKRATLTNVRNFAAYLRAITRNQVITQWRKQNLEKRYIEQQKYLLNYVVETSDINAEAISAVNRAIQHLPTQQQIVYILKREENWKKKRIAEVLQISPDKVRSQMRNALRSIKKYVLRQMA